MSIRITALYIYVAFFLAYAWKDWFKSLCGLILMMAVIHHEDMPKTMFGIQGFNVWNILFLGIFLAWIASRRREGLTWDMPRHINVLLLMYLGVILVGFLRALFDRSYIEDYPVKDLISERLINTVKWVLPGVLLFDGCRSRRRLITIISCLLVVYFLVAIQILKRLPLDGVLSGSGIEKTRQKCEDIGYGPVDMSVFCAGAFWGMLSVLSLIRQKICKVFVIAGAGIVVIAQALTGGRAGYLAWCVTGLMLCLLKWRKYLVLAPAVVILLPIVFPGVAERFLVGFDESDAAGNNIVDDYSMTSGRTVIWPYVIDKIGRAPIIGYGRLGMRRTGLYDWLMTNLNESFPHAHNMYLETLLDNGILGSLPILLFWAMVVVYSAILFKSNNHLCSAVGGLAFSLTFVQLVAGVGSQHFYPEESTLGMWAAVFLSLRVYLEWVRMRKGNIAVDNLSYEQLWQRHQSVNASVYMVGIEAR